ncbi:hypothetical protein CDAR_116491 [Caerostris darwini]|uniref:Uncharacterized protein n=1 Tax=Caerostris darwini TaxID=1538125 RepID=A0AAV4X5Q6_9ARAC|nr:hypothetical protein CDAR_116491 [Caerostris darwini]
MNLFFTKGINTEELVQIEIIQTEAIVKLCFCKLSLLGVAGSPERSIKDEIFKTRVHRLPIFFSKNTILENKDQYLLHDTLSLVCKFSCLTGSIVHHYCSTSDVPQIPSPLSHDFMNPLIRKIECDDTQKEFFSFT